MNTVTIVLLVIAIVLIAVMVALYFFGKKAQKKKDEQDEQLAAAAQSVTMLIIDKKRLRIKDSGLPQQVIDQTPKYLRRLYITQVRGLRGPLEKPQGKKSFRAKLQEKYNKANAELKAEKSAASGSKSKKK